MPTTSDNFAYWNDQYDWGRRGEEWSAAWGGSQAQWGATIFPRICSFVPVDTILEIAPGFGRWTHFLSSHCKRLLAVDLSPRCIDGCRRRFFNLSHVEWFVNDGLSLEMIPDHTVDFVFSFDSLVHADAPAMKSYMQQLPLKMKSSAKGFIHHSNLGAYPRPRSASLLADRYLWRSSDMAADLFRTFCTQYGLRCIRQELVNWCDREVLLDCFSTFANAPARENSCETVRNWSFMAEAAGSRYDANGA